MKSFELCPGKHLESVELGGKDFVATVREVLTNQEVGKDKVKKGVIYFKEFERGVVVNKTIRMTMELLHGDEVSEWVGRKVILYPTETEFEGSMKPVVRIRRKLVSESPAVEGK